MLLVVVVLLLLLLLLLLVVLICLIFVWVFPLLVFFLWHSCLGHASSSCLRFLTSTRALKNLQTCDISYCSRCKLVKFFVLPFNQNIFVFSSSFDLIHSDIWVLSPISIKRGSRYHAFIIIIIIIDDHTHHC